MENQTTTEEFETVEEKVENTPVNDFMSVDYYDNNETFDKMLLGIEFGRVEFEGEHYLVILEGERREIIGPFENKDGVDSEASRYATDEALSSLTAFYAEVTHEQFCLAEKLGLFTVTDRYGQSYIKEEDYADLEDADEEGEEEDDEEEEEETVEETVEEYIKTLGQNDFFEIDVSEAFGRLFYGTELCGVEYKDKHYLVIFEDNDFEVSGPYESEDEVEKEAADYAWNRELDTLNGYYTEITYKQYCLARKLDLDTVTDSEGRDYIKNEDFCDVEDVEEDED